VRAAISIAIGIAVVAGLVSTVVDATPRSLRILDAEEQRFAGLTRAEREQTFGTAIPTRMDVFDFYRRLLRRDDRFYVQVINEGFGTADKATVIRSVARYYLAPAVEVDRPEDATVVLSYDADPGTLPLKYSKQTRAGLQLLFVSRVAK
jgi:hypothetical protein